MQTIIDARVAIFDNPTTDWKLVNDPNGPTNIPQGLEHEFKNKQSVATLSWNTSPSAGLPVAPYKVAQLVGLRVENTHPTIFNSIELNQVNGFTKHFPSPYLALKVAPGYLYCHCQSVKNFEKDSAVYAIDITGREIPDTRRLVTGDPFVIFGPGIYGIVSIGKVHLGETRIGLLDSFNGLEHYFLAEAAPYFPNGQLFGKQQILSARYSDGDAYITRLGLDALARNLADVPLNKSLEDDIHRVSPVLHSARTLTTSLYEKIGNGYAEYAANPTKLVKGAIDLPNGGKTVFNALPSNMVQLMAHFGPIESATLGHSISLPLKYGPPHISNGYGEKMQAPNADFPIPLYLITGWNADYALAKPGMTLEELAEMPVKTSFVARFVPSATLPISRALSVDQFPPEARDTAAVTQISLEFRGRSVASNIYLERKSDMSPTDLIKDPDGKPKQFNTGSISIPTKDDFLTQIIDTNRPVPFESKEVISYNVYRRDVFGRWKNNQSEECEIHPWPVQQPSLISSIPVTNMGNQLLDLDIGWDWRKRSPKEFRFSLALGETTDNKLEELLPEDNVLLPIYGNKEVSLSLVFKSTDPDILPTVSMPDKPVGAPLPTIQFIPHTKPDTSGSPVLSLRNPQPEFDRTEFLDRQYKLTIPLGKLDAVFGSSNLNKQIVVNVDAQEQVSGARRSEPNKPMFSALYDPRPAEFENKPVHLLWTAQPDGDGVARVTLPLPTLVSGEVSNYQLWRCHEASLINFIVENHKSPELVLSKLSEITSKNIRLQMLINLLSTLKVEIGNFDNQVNSFFESAESSVTSEGIEFALSGSLSGIEFVFISAMSHTGVNSVKPDVFHSIGVAVPTPRHFTRPTLKVITEDDFGFLKLTGHALFIISSSEVISLGKPIFFWEKEYLADSAEDMFISFDDVSEIADHELVTWVSDVQGFLNNLPGLDHRFYLAKLHPDWDRRKYCVELRWPNEISTMDTASPRSNVVTCFQAPQSLPELSVVTGTNGKWVIGVGNIPGLNSTTELGSNHVSISVKSRDKTVLLSGISSTLDLPLIVGVEPNTVTISLSTTSSQLLVEATWIKSDMTLELSFSDPLDRGARIILA